MSRKRVRPIRNSKDIVDSAKDHLDELSVCPANDRKELRDQVHEMIDLTRDIQELSLYHSSELLPGSLLRTGSWNISACL
jgi:hypothetical protein